MATRGKGGTWAGKLKEELRDRESCVSVPEADQACDERDKKDFEQGILSDCWETPKGAGP